MKQLPFEPRPSLNEENVNPFPELASHKLLVMTLMVGHGCEMGKGSLSSHVQAAKQDSISTREVVPTGNLTVARGAHTATLLPNGTVLLVGGMEGAGATAESYHPTRGVFIPGGRMVSERAGGQASAELYDSITGTFRRIGSMTMIRHKHAATVLRDGRVLIVVGSDARDGRGRYATAELFDPTTGAFGSVSAMSAERFKLPHAVVLLRTGEVLVAGGAERAEIYDPVTSSFRMTLGSLGRSLVFYGDSASRWACVDRGRLRFADPTNHRRMGVPSTVGVALQAQRC
jgi:hypothetical protein